MGKFVEIRSMTEVVRLGRRASGELLFKEYQVYVWQDAKAMEIDGSDGSTTL